MDSQLPPTLPNRCLGFDAQLARLRNETEDAARERRWAMGIHPVYNRVDTCAGEFPAMTPYL
ncbi:MAG TPA: hypothetical protein VE913_22245, partial [Longimicrobium sp.]|nr:hypothetical protein [Longimicrobium sp.]